MHTRIELQLTNQSKCRFGPGTPQYYRLLKAMSGGSKSGHNVIILIILTVCIAKGAAEDEPACGLTVCPGEQVTILYPNTVYNLPRHLLESNPPYGSSTAIVDSELLVEVTTGNPTTMQLTLLETGDGIGISIRTKEEFNGAQQWYTGRNKNTEGIGTFMELEPQQLSQPNHVCCTGDTRILWFTASSNLFVAEFWNGEYDSLSAFTYDSDTVTWWPSSGGDSIWVILPESNYKSSQSVLFEVMPLLTTPHFKESGDENSDFLSMNMSTVAPSLACQDPFYLAFTTFEYMVRNVNGSGNIQYEPAIVIRNDAERLFLAVNIDEEYAIRPSRKADNRHFTSELLQLSENVFNATAESLGENHTYFQNSDLTRVTSPDQRFFSIVPLNRNGSYYVLCSLHHKQNCLFLSPRGLQFVSIPSPGEAPLEPNFRERTLDEVLEADAKLREEGIGFLVAFNKLSTSGNFTPIPIESIMCDFSTPTTVSSSSIPWKIESGPPQVFVWMFAAIPATLYWLFSLHT